MAKKINSILDTTTKCTPSSSRKVILCHSLFVRLYLEYWLAWSSPVQVSLTNSEESPADTKVVQGMENVVNEESLRELGIRGL